MELTPTKIKAYVKNALLDGNLKTAVDRATQTALTKRQDKVDHMPYWEDLRHAAHAAKREVMEHLDRYLEEFEKNCQKNGIQVHWAETAEEARAIIYQLIQDNNVKSIVKSKSLTTEELHLNHFLIERGIETLETDLGEYIVQLLDQIPSHLTAPALHLTRKDIARIFQEKLGVDYTEEPTELAAIARSQLRRKFLAADMGISGVNFAIADAGAVTIVENEANAALTISVPKIHVAVMGIEKLIPRLQDLSIFLRLLGPSATGQKASSYVHIVSGPSPASRKEGPEQVHVVILDNGRSKILADPQLRELLFCIRCGACLNVCPIYQQVGGHSYGWVYMGPIGATLIPSYLGTKAGKYAPYLSSLCGACFEICPVRINIPHHLVKLRNDIVNDGHSLLLERLGISVWAFLAKHPLFYRFATWFPGKLQQLLPKGKSFPGPGWSPNQRPLPAFDSRGFRKRLKELERKKAI